MASHSSNCSGSHEARRETPYALKTLGRRGGKLLDDAQRVAKATSGQNSSSSLPGGADSRDIIIKCLQIQLAKMTQILVDNKLVMPSKTTALAQNEDKIKEPTLPPRQGQERRQHRSYVSLDNRTYSKSIALSKQRRSPNRAKSGVDLRETLNAK